MYTIYAENQKLCTSCFFLFDSSMFRGPVGKACVPCFIPPHNGDSETVAVYVSSFDLVIVHWGTFEDVGIMFLPKGFIQEAMHFADRSVSILGALPHWRRI